jgi:hypothetical protein
MSKRRTQVNKMIRKKTNSNQNQKEIGSMKNYKDVGRKFVKALRAKESMEGINTKEMFEIMASILPQNEADNFTINPSVKKIKEGAECSELLFFVALQAPEYIKKRRKLHLSYRKAQFKMAKYLTSDCSAKMKSAILITDNWYWKLSNWQLDEKIYKLSKNFHIEIYMVDLDDELILVDEEFENAVTLGFMELPMEEYMKLLARVRREKSLPDRKRQYWMEFDEWKKMNVKTTNN